MITHWNLFCFSCRERLALFVLHRHARFVAFVIALSAMSLFGVFLVMMRLIATGQSVLGVLTPSLAMGLFAFWFEPRFGRGISEARRAHLDHILALHGLACSLPTPALKGFHASLWESVFEPAARSHRAALELSKTPACAQVHAKVSRL